MRSIIPKLILIFLVSNPSNSIIYGQSNTSAIPFNIEIKKHIKNIKSVKLSSIGKELTYIPLETNTNCLIQNIYNVGLSESYIFIHDHDRILQFDRSGKFTRQIGSNGRGPKEYFRIYDFCIDEQKKEVYIISSPQLLSVFDFNGVFINAYKLSHRITQIILKDKNTFMFHLVNSPGLNDPSWIVTARNGKTLTTMKKSLTRINKPGVTVLNAPLYLFNNTAHFMEFGIDTLYYFKDYKKSPYAIFFLDDLKMDPDLLITEAIAKNHKFYDRKLSPGSIKENETFLFIKLMHGFSNGYSCTIFSKNTNEVIFLKDNTFVNDLSGGVPFWPKQIINDNLLVDYIDAFDLFKYPLPSSLRGKITESSNPVLLILK